MTRINIHLLRMTFLSIVLAVPLAYAAEASKSETQTASTAKETKEAAAEKPRPPKKDSKKDSKDGGIFVPSEEISEDFAVSFPVDI